nr:[protein-PII] uridylyltransferase [Parvularcula dongshanensis]
MREARRRFFAESRTGTAIARGLSHAADEALCALRAATEAEEIALVAIGGYGRGRLAPYSDIDLLILTRPDGRQAATRILYPLYDSGLTIAQCVYDPASAVRAAQEDLTRRTAFLDARFLCGEPALFDDFHARFERLRIKTVAAFVTAKLAERDARHKAQGASRYLIEPDVKEGKGGLRDLDLLHWLDRYVTGTAEAPVQRAMTPGLFTEEEELRLRRVQDFLWSVRVHLHDLHGRADEKLSFSLQPALAARLGYQERRNAPAVERLMKHYFLTATEVGRLTGTACAMLEMRALKRAPRLFPLGSKTKTQGFGTEQNIVLKGERLSFADEGRASVRDLFALFLAAGRSGHHLHPESFKTAIRLSRRVDRAVRTDPEIADLFRAILRETGDLERILRRMTECGLLSRYLPAYGRIVGKAEYGLFRRYTLDEHVLRSCGVFALLRAGENEADFPLTTPLAKARDPVPLLLSLLLQETEAGLASPSPARLERRVRIQALRLVGEAEAEEVVFAVRNRDLLARVAACRNVAERSAIEDVAATIGDKSRLDHLSIVTACRHRTAGHGSWEAWNQRDARLLIAEVAAFIEDGERGLAAFIDAREASLREETARVSEATPAQREAFFARLRPSFWSQASPLAAARLIELTARADADGVHAAVCVAGPDDGLVQVLIYADDRPGLFADVSGSVAQAGATVWGAAAFPIAGAAGQPDKAVTVLELKRPGTPPESLELEPGEAKRLQAQVLQAARGEAKPPVIPGPGISDRRSVFDVPAAVRIFEDASPDSLVVEAEGRDRPGLLHLLAAALTGTGVSVRFAFVATYGERAVDTFYLQNKEGRKIEDAATIQTIRARLIEVLRVD